MKIAAIIPVFYPDNKILNTLLEKIYTDVHIIYLYNNGGFDKNNISHSKLQDKIAILNKSGNINIGVAKAYNSCAKAASDDNCDAIVLLDQDSTPDLNMIQTLSFQMQKLISNGECVAAIGPTIVDEMTGNLKPFLVIGRWGLKKIHVSQYENTFQCDFLISSGSLMPLQSFFKIGMMDEKFLIDHVDTEWCFRAKHAGFRCFGVSNSFLHQRFGESNKNVKFFLNCPNYSCNRLSHLFKNTIILCRREYIPFVVKKHILIRSIAILVISFSRFVFSNSINTFSRANNKFPFTYLNLT